MRPGGPEDLEGDGDGVRAGVADDDALGARRPAAAPDEPHVGRRQLARRHRESAVVVAGVAPHLGGHEAGSQDAARPGDDDVGGAHPGGGDGAPVGGLGQTRRRRSTEELDAARAAAGRACDDPGVRGRCSDRDGAPDVAQAGGAEALLAGAHERGGVDQHAGRLGQADAFARGRQLHGAAHPGRADREAGGDHSHGCRPDDAGHVPHVRLLERRLPKGTAMNTTNASSTACPRRHHG